MSDAANPVSLGRQLYERGWRQGSIFRVPNAKFLKNCVGLSTAGEQPTIENRQLRSRESLILVTHECDLVASDADEPCVEALICRRATDRDRLMRVQNSARYFPVGGDFLLVAEARYRLFIEKQVLLDIQPEGWPGSERELEWFIRWLGNRYSRPAIDDRLVDSFQRPLVDAIHQIADTNAQAFAHFREAVQQLRASFPKTAEQPYVIHLVAIKERASLTAEEDAAIQTIFATIRRSLNPSAVTLPDDLRIVTEAQMSVAEYFGTWPIYLDYLTYGGEETDRGRPTEGAY